MKKIEDVAQGFNLQSKKQNKLTKRKKKDTTRCPVWAGESRVRCSLVLMEEADFRRNPLRRDFLNVLNQHNLPTRNSASKKSS